MRTSCELKCFLSHGERRTYDMQVVTAVCQRLILSKCTLNHFQVTLRSFPLCVQLYNYRTLHITCLFLENWFELSNAFAFVKDNPLDVVHRNGSGRLVLVGCGRDGAAGFVAI